MSKDTNEFRIDVDVDLDLLEEAFTLLLGRLRDGGGSTYILDRDFYWVVERDAKFDAATTPEKPGLGLARVTDELEWLASMSADSGEHSVPDHLVWLGEILAAIGHRVKHEQWWPEDDTV